MSRGRHQVRRASRGSGFLQFWSSLSAASICVLQAGRRSAVAQAVHSQRTKLLARGRKTQSFSFPNASVERLWRACVQAIGVIGYNVVHSDQRAGQISFNTGRSVWSWAGQD